MESDVMSNKTFFLDNPFWRDPDRTSATAILVTEDAGGNRTNRQLDLDKIRPDGSECTLFKQLIEEVGIRKIDANTDERRKRKEAEATQNRIQDEQKKKAAQLESLFTLKIKAFEIDAVKESKNKALRSKLRKAKNEIELNAYVTMMLIEEHNAGTN